MAARVTSVAATGYFLLEIQAIPTDYNSELAGLSSGIIQIISNAYDSGGLITSYNDSALSFQNNTTSVITYGSFKVGAHVVRNNYVIVKGKRGFYCHSLLSLPKGRLGRIPHDALHEKIVRRHALS